jgi:hypothetical protein
MKTLSQDSLSPDRDLYRGPPECEREMLTTRPRCSVVEASGGLCEDGDESLRPIQCSSLFIS